MDRKSLLKVYPEINKLRDPYYKELAINSLLLGVEMGNWDKKGGIEKCPVAAEGILRENCTVTGLEHMRSVADATDKVIECLGPWMEKMNYRLDREFTLCGALLHDVGKLIEFDRNEKIGRASCRERV